MPATDRHPLSTPFPMNPTLPEPVRVAVGPATRRQVLRHGGVAVAGLAAFAAARRASATEAATAAGQAPVEADALRRGGADGANPTAAPDDREVAAQMAAGEVPHLAPGRPGVDYTPVVTPGGANLPFKVVDGIKVFHLVAEEVEHEFAPGLIATCWGYNGRCHGPTIEAVEGDRVRIYVSNRLDAPTTVHWHGDPAAQRHGRRGRRVAAGDPHGRDLSVRVHPAPARDVHVPRAPRRDDADGHGDDGHAHRPPAALRRQRRAAAGRLGAGAPARPRLRDHALGVGRSPRAPAGRTPT